MGKKNRLSRDQKRKAKLKKRAGRSLQETSSAYFGKKYRRDDLVLVYWEAESGIHEADLLTKRAMNDSDVEEAIEFLIEELRRGPYPENPVFEELQTSVEGLIVASILEHWEDLFERQPNLGRTLLIGVLRTTMGSLQTRGEMTMSWRGYLDYIAKFLKTGAPI